MLSRFQRWWSLRKAALRYLKLNGARATLAAIAREILGQLRMQSSGLASMNANSILIAYAHVLVVSADPASASHTYRVENLVAALNLSGIRASWIYQADFEKLTKVPKQVRVIVFWRTAIEISSHASLKDIQGKSKVTIAYDTDDLTFDPRHYNAKYVAGVRVLGRRHADDLVNALAPQKKKQILASDFFVGTTQTLCDVVSSYGINTRLIPNCLPLWMEEQARTYNQQRKSAAEGDNFRLLYMSGSDTHQDDFQAAWPAVREFLAAHRNVSLTVVGYPPIDFNNLPSNIKSQIFHRAFVPHKSLISEIAKYDVSLAPVDYKGNFFVESKSALRYLQAACVGVPTIASPSQEFRNVITNNVNGWLADSKDEWLETLSLAMSDKVLNQVGMVARNDWHTEHSFSQYQQKVADTYNEMLNKPLTSTSGHSPKDKIRIAWVLPDLPTGSGGHRNVLRFAHYLPSSKYEKTVFLVQHNDADNKPEQIAREAYGLFDFSISQNLEEISDFDIVFATHHSTVTHVKNMSRASAKLAYLVQDFESYFYPMGSQYLDALMSLFDEELQIICSGSWMAKKIKAVTNREVPHFDFPVNRQIYFRSGSARDRAVVFFAKADTPRRLFDLGIAALEVVRHVLPDVQISLFGGDSIQLQGYSDRFEVLGKLPTIDDLAKIYNKATVGVVFSSSNPSLVPYEMMACGLPVVDIRVPGDDFLKYSEAYQSELVYPTPSDVAIKIIELLGNSDKARMLSEEGLLLVDKMPSESAVVSLMEKFLHSI